MSLTVEIVNEERPFVSSQKIVAIVSVSSGGSIATPTEHDPGGDVAGTIGYGPGTDLAEEILRQSSGGGTPTKVIHQKITGGVAGLCSSVTETPSGTGPLITVAGAPYDKYSASLWIVKAGALGTARARLALDGATYGDEFPIPVKLRGSFTSAIDLTGIVLADLNTLTLIATSDIGGPITVTFTTPSDITDIATQITTQAASGTDEFAARIVSEKYLQIYSLTDGSTSTLSFGAGTANTILGLTGSVTYTGSDSTYAIPNTGMTVTFPSTSDYVVNTYYTWTTTQPRFSVAASTTAMDTLRDWALVNGVSIAHTFLLVDPVDGAETLQFATALSARRAEWYASPYFRLCNFYMGASLHTASATKATNDTNITSNDAAIMAAMVSHVDPFVTVCVGDCYQTSGFGALRRSVLHWLALFESRERDSADPGAGDLPGFSCISMKDAALTTLARNELTATHKMRSARFTVARREGADERISRGVTRANPALTPKFKHLGVVNAGLRAARAILPIAKLNENTDPLVAPSGKIRAEIGDAIEAAGNAELADKVVSPGHASAARLTVDRDEVISTTENLTLTAEVQCNAQIISVALTVGVSGQFTVS